MNKEGDKGGRFASSPPLSPLEKTLSQAKLESSNNAKKVESSVDSKETSAQPKRYPLFSKETSACAERYPLFSKKATLCHADFQSALNDAKPLVKVDSSEQAQNVENLESIFK